MHAVQWPFLANQLPAGSALVGGAIRDVFLEKFGDRHDLDFVVPAKAIELTRSFAKDLGGTCIVLDEERDMARLALGGWTVDFACQVGNSLEADLLRRDYRVNAIALTFDSDLKILDPTGGLNDLKKKQLVAISEKNLIDDPLRLLRGLRLLAEIGFLLEAKTRTLIKKHCNLLTKVAPERIQNEIQKLVVAPWADEVIPVLQGIGLLAPWEDSDTEGNQILQDRYQPIALNSKELSKALQLVRLTHLLSDAGLEFLRFSRSECQRCKALRKWQKRNDGKAFLHLSESERLQLHQDLEDDLPALILGLAFDDQVTWIKRWRDISDPLFHPCAPLDGNILKEVIGVPPGPALGDLLRYLCHERAFDRLRNADEVLQAARDWWQQKETLL